MQGKERRAKPTGRKSSQSCRSFLAFKLSDPKLSLAGESPGRSLAVKFKPRTQKSQIELAVCCALRMSNSAVIAALANHA